MSQLFDLVHSAQRALDYHSERHNVLASNIANVDTPGFEPLELVRSGEESMQGSMDVSRTHQTHLSIHGTPTESRVESAEERVIRAGGDGNSVSLEREMSKLAANDVRFEAATRIVRQHLGMLRYTANDANG